MTRVLATAMLLALACCMLPASVGALSVRSPTSAHAPTGSCHAAAPAGAVSTHEASRRATLRTALLAPLVAVPGAALAKPAKGSKEEKEYNDCLSLCAYYCMKPKGQFTKTRTDCLQECKPICKEDPKAKFTG